MTAWTTPVAALLILLAAAPNGWAHIGGQPLHSGPLQVDADGFVYVVNPDSDSVSRLSPLSGGAQTVLWESAPGVVGDYPRTLTLTTGSIYTANQNDDTISRLGKDGAAQGSVSLGFGCAPFGISTTRDENVLFVSCQGTQELVVLGTDLSIVKRIALDWPMPRALAVSGDDTRVYVSHFLTSEPNQDAHVSEVDATTNTLTARRYLTVPADRTTCETQNSGQGVTNVVNSLLLTPPGSPTGDQLWVGGTLQNNLTKGLFRRYTPFAENAAAESARFDVPCPEDDLDASCTFEAFPRAGRCNGGTDAGKPCRDTSQCAGGTCVVQKNLTDSVKRNVYKSSFHDITRFVIWKLDLATGEVAGKIDIDEANHATDMVFSPDGTRAYVVDQTFNSYHVFNTLRGQGTNPATLFRPVAAFGPFSADPSRPCDADALGSVRPERPFLLDPQAQIAPIESGDPIKILQATPTTGTPVNTGVDFNTRKYHMDGSAEMRSVPDAVGTAPIGVGLSPDGCVAYVLNYLARNMVAVSAQPQSANPGCAAYDPIVDFRCTGDLTQACRTNADCTGGSGFCNHPGGPSCTTDADCTTEPCVRDNRCIPLVASDPPAATTALVSEEVPAEILDGKILFNTAARDNSVPNGVGLDVAAPLFNDVRRGCAQDTTTECRSDLNCAFCANDGTATPGTCASNADCGGARCVLDDFYCSNDFTKTCSTDLDCIGGTCESTACDVVLSLPGEIVSTAHDASYVTCTSCHVDFGGQDGRTWDFSQFGASLRNTMDLRGRSQAAPGTCAAVLSANAAKVGGTCHFDAECGTGSGPGACQGNPDMAPEYLGPADKARFFNPMISVHWNGDRMEVEGFEFTYRSLLGAGDCDGLEHDPNGCVGALIPRSLSVSTAVVPLDGTFEGDLKSTLRNVMVDEPTLGKPVNATVRLTHMADFVYSLTRFPRNPFLGPNGAAISEAARRGRVIFNDAVVNCAFCHSGPSAGNQLFTDKRPAPGFDTSLPPGSASNNVYLRHPVGTENVFDMTDPKAVAAANNTFQNGVLTIPGSRGNLVEYVTPVLNDIWNTPPFLHDGSASTLLDVVRPCNSATMDCNLPGTGRNVDDKHGVTSVLTPQQLNDLVEFQLAPHGPVGQREEVVKAGTLDVKKLLLNFGKKAGRGRFQLVAILDPRGFPVDGKDGLEFTLAVPDGERMALHEIAATAAQVRGGGRRFRFRTRRAGPTQGPLRLTLKRIGGGRWRLVVRGRRADLSALRTGVADVTAALVAGQTQFVQNRMLTSKKKGRILKLVKKRKKKRQGGGP